jgi:hypothetical protein
VYFHCIISFASDYLQLWLYFYNVLSLPSADVYIFVVYTVQCADEHVVLEVDIICLLANFVLNMLGDVQHVPTEFYEL